MDEERERARSAVGELLTCGYQEAGAPPEAFLARVRRGEMGGVILFARNVPTLESALEIRRALDEAGGQSLLVAIDEEGGWVSRLPAPWPRLPAAMALGAAAADRPEAVREYARRLGAALRALGINQDYAPVLDVNTAPDNPIIGSRAFGDRPETVASLGSAFAAGLEAAGVIATGKHFPGHGATRVDSHLDLPVLDFGLERLEAVELVPFAAAAAAGMSAIMTAHVALPNVAEAPDLPATLSRQVLTGLVRERLRFDGLLVTDCMEMQGVTRARSTPEAAVMAVAAGADQVLVSHTAELQEATLGALERAVADGRLAPERVLEAAARVRRLRDRVAALPPAPAPEQAVSLLAEAAGRLAAESVYVPAPPASGAAGGGEGTATWYVPAAAAGDARWRLILGGVRDAADRAAGAAAQVVEVGPEGEPAGALAPAGSRVVLVVPSLRRHPGWLALWQRLEGRRRSAVVVEDPYDAAHLTGAEHVVVAPTPAPAAVARAVAVLLGRLPAPGRPPIAPPALPGALQGASFSALEHRADGRHG